MSRDEMLMNVAGIISARSTCSRASVGAVISRDGRILSSGYNGAPAGVRHCDHTCTCNGSGVPPRAVPIDGHDPACLSLPESCVSVHAEANAIVWAARHGVATMGAELHTTYMPCLACAQLIVNAGIVRVAYQHKYRLENGLKLLVKARVETLWVPE